MDVSPPAHVHQTRFEEEGWNIQKISNEENGKIKAFQTNFPKQGAVLLNGDLGNNTGDDHLQKTFPRETSFQRISYQKFMMLAKCHFSDKEKKNLFQFS